MTDRTWKRLSDVVITTLLTSLLAYAVASGIQGSPSAFFGALLGVVGIASIPLLALLILLYPGTPAPSTTRSEVPAARRA